ncbi:14782_t:CDS:2 [Funneliformis mosseae]|uniref:14782_t:CDS:1 n=1 Tax=Funneliformis mosseae TaxID=27381 RepID=A0A9N9CEQ2_FUNMO|nr:14782_t:CDS:2 [Funneliformis mosseae]
MFLDDQLFFVRIQRRGYSPFTKTKYFSLGSDKSRRQYFLVSLNT